MAVKTESNIVNRVRIPSNLNSDFDHFFSSLKLQILKRAVKRAGAQVATDEFRVLRGNDLLLTAREAFAEAVIGPDTALSLQIRCRSVP